MFTIIVSHDTVTARMTSALRSAVTRAILMFHNCNGQIHKTASADHNFWRERKAEADSNQGPSAYQPNALLLGQTSSQLYIISLFSHLHSSLFPLLISLMVSVDVKQQARTWNIDYFLLHPCIIDILHIRHKTKVSYGICSICCCCWFYFWPSCSNCQIPDYCWEDCKMWKQKKLVGKKKYKNQPQ